MFPLPFEKPEYRLSILQARSRPSGCCQGFEPAAVADDDTPELTNTDNTLRFQVGQSAYSGFRCRTHHSGKIFPGDIDAFVPFVFDQSGGLQF